MQAVITAYNMVSPLGQGKNETWKNVFSAAYLPRYKLNKSEFELADALFEGIKPELEGIAPERTAVVVGNSKYNFSSMGDDSRFLDFFLQHNLSSYLARKVGRGCIPYSVSAACATGLVNVIRGVEMLSRGLVDVVIAGSIETSKVPIIEAAFSQMGIISRTGQTRPFCQNRDGFIIGEGGALFVLQRKDNNIKNSAPVIKGYFYGNDCTDAIAFDRDGKSVEMSVKKSMQMTDLSGIDYINTHGTATDLNDLMEINVLSRMFCSGHKPYLGATKSYTGHLLGATGSVELALCLLSMEQKRLIPNKFIDQLLPEIKPYLREPAELNSFLTLNYGFGGHVAALVVVN
ncbi:MAG: beta-ketoacyl synthase N-terminal-like domain-containing protein [Candidatus Margulisbacteria bacterium]|nr:beta-ketoacyl synthase N-terminal-like domain-containing protein [Candidatus Margulisiibacteriota bacterium]